MACELLKSQTRLFDSGFEMMRSITSMIFFAATLFLGSAANATVIFDGFGPGDSFNPGRVVSSANTDVGIPNNTSTDRDWAMGFTPTGNDFTLDSIEIALSLASGENEVDIYLRSSTASLPGALLESWHLSNQLTSSGSIFTLLSAANPLLENGEQYWIEMSAGTNNAGVSKTGWQSSDGAASARAEQFDEGSWISSGTFSYAYRVNGTVAVPAPATVGLLALSLIGFSFSRRRR